MSDTTFQPPIHLDPNQDPAQQVAFINQNFQNLAATLESNSFRIIDVIDTDFTSLELNTGSNMWGSVTNSTSIPHNFNFIPIPFGFMTTGDGFFKPLEIASSYVIGQSPYWAYIRISCDIDNVYIVSTITGFNIDVLPSTADIKIYLTQLSAD